MADKQFLKAGGNLEPWVCYRCGKPLNLNNSVVLENDGNSADFHDFGCIGRASLGLALFGRDCASYLRNLTTKTWPDITKNEPEVVRKYMISVIESTTVTTPSLVEYYSCLLDVLKSKNE